MISEESSANGPLDLQVCDMFHHAIELIGKRWSGAVISVMIKGATRYCELREAIPGISDRLLADRLKELEQAGIVARDVEPTRPPQVSYRLTPKGQALGPVVDSITAWSHDWE